MCTQIKKQNFVDCVMFFQALDHDVVYDLPQLKCIHYLNIP